jgi:glucose/arabinose dehydrogenase
MTRHRPSVALAVLLGLGALTLARCSGDTSSSTSDTTSTSTSTSTSTATSSPTASSAPATNAPSSTVTATYATKAQLDSLRLGLRDVAKLDEPIALTTRSGRPLLFVAERPGLVRTVDPVTGAVSDPIVDIRSETTSDSERGLLGLAFSADGMTLYLSFTDSQGDTRLDAIPMVSPAGDDASSAAVQLSGRRTVLFQKQPFSNHNGGNVLLGPDGMVWFGLGDGGSQRDPSNNGQNTNVLLGKILRIDPTRPTANAGYAVPADNPFVNGGGAPEVWAYGLRNPWRFSFDRGSGDLWIGDVGESAYEEIDQLTATTGRGRAANLQWSQREGTHQLKGAAPAGSTRPVHDYGRDDGSCSVTGGYVYRGATIPTLQGIYLFTDYCEGSLRALVPDGKGASTVKKVGVALGKNDVASFGEGADGELYVLGLDSGTLRRIVAA